MITPARRERMLGGLWGSLVGDALGVPVEFKSREEVRRQPVTGMRGYGTHQQPAGTWSDDSSLLLCSAESLVERGGFDAADMGARFVRWEGECHWTPHGRVFDIGGTTSQALSRLRMGTPPEQAGGGDEHSNGNGSLMRILPVALWFNASPVDEMLDAVHRASALTHRHPRSQMACGVFALVVRELLGGATPAEAYENAVRELPATYQAGPFLAERQHFCDFEAGGLATVPEKEIRSGGYVVHTLTASVWCLLTSASFEETVLKAVNLGSDTDTTGCVAGAIAGIYHGQGAIPADWISTLARKGDVATLFEAFTRANEPASS
jgi:ADP-ribosyl-[dinitrogen reductase] hydrolase